MIIAYCRTSTREQKLGKTIENQVSAIKDFSKEKIHKFFMDEGISGSYLERPALDQLRGLVRDGGVSKILIYHPDRLSRTQLHQLMLLDEFRKADVEVIFVSLPEYNTQSEESRVVNQSVWSMVSELERLRIRERTRLGRINAVKKGRFMTSQVPYGYSVSKGKISINKDEIEIAKEILELALKGFSERKIIKYLTDKKYKPRNGGKWQRSFINNMLKKNLEFYAGTWYYQKTKRIESKNGGKSTLAPRIKDDWLSIKHDLGIISKKQVGQIREIRDKNRTYSTGNQKNKYLLQGIVYCEECGQRCYADSFHGVPYYRCANRRRRYPLGSTCTGGSKKAEVLEKLAWQKVKNFINDKDVIKAQLKTFVDLPNSNRIEREFAQIERKLRKLQDGYLAEVFSLSEVKRRSTELKQRRKELEGELLSVKILPKDLEKNLMETLEDIKLLTKHADYTTKRELINLFSVALYFNFQTGAYKIEGEFPVHNAGTRTLSLLVSVVNSKIKSDYQIPFTSYGFI